MPAKQKHTQYKLRQIFFFHYSSSSSFISVVVTLSASMLVPTLPLPLPLPLVLVLVLVAGAGAIACWIPVDKLAVNPGIRGSVAPETLALCFFSGLPTKASVSRALEASSFPSKLLLKLVDSVVVAGGVVRDAGVTDLEAVWASGLAAAADRGSAECCRFS